jgi:hypothetical protein
MAEPPPIHGENRGISRRVWGLSLIVVFALTESIVSPYTVLFSSN